MTTMTIEATEIPPRRPKQRALKPLSSLKPGTSQAVRQGCKCPTSGLFVSDRCPLHKNGVTP